MWDSGPQFQIRVAYDELVGYQALRSIRSRVSISI